MLQQLQQEILALAKEQDARILAHSYQSPEILEIADLQGDSFRLSAAAQDLSCRKVILCGVRFMADTVKILSPEKEVVLAHAGATCPMAEQISPERVVAYRKEHPDHKIVAYINTTTELKAVCDCCVTSSSAEKIVRNLGAKDVLFLPDKNLGSHIKKSVPEVNVTIWDGCCPVHNAVTAEDAAEMKRRYPDYPFLMHPELPQEVLAYADLIGSTADILQYARTHEENCVIGTEKSIADTLNLEFPNREYPLLSKKLMCADMRLTTLMDVKKALLGTGGEVITLDETLRQNAKHAIDEMIRLGK